MKGGLGIFALCMTASALFSRAHVEQPRTIFIPRPFSSYVLYTDGFSLLASHDKNHKRVLLFGHSAMYQESFKENKCAPFFLGHDRKEITVDQGEDGDLNSDWFHIDSQEGSTYKSTISVMPRRTAAGVCLRAQYIMDDLLEGLWLALAAPLVHVTHQLNPCEIKSSGTLVDSSSQFSSVLSCLDWDNWRAGKWSQESQSLTGFDDITCQLGFDMDGPLGSLQQVALELVLPVGGRPTGQYLFEPLIGSQGAFGLGCSIKTIAPIMELGFGVSLAYVGFLGYRYHTQTQQPRLFDLKGQPFSRYFVYMDTALAPNITNVALKASNGGNFFLRDALVVPGATGQSITGLELKYKQHRLNVGYLYWWRAAEQVTFAAPLDRTFAVPSPQGISLDESGQQLWLTGPQIRDAFSIHDAAVSTAPSVVHDVEFDIDSGAMPHVASSTLFLDYNGSFIHDVATCTLRMGAGYEFASAPAVLDSIHVWCGIGITL